MFNTIFTFFRLIKICADKSRYSLVVLLLTNCILDLFKVHCVFKQISKWWIKIDFFSVGLHSIWTGATANPKTKEIFVVTLFVLKCGCERVFVVAYRNSLHQLYLYSPAGDLYIACAVYILYSVVHVALTDLAAEILVPFVNFFFGSITWTAYAQPDSFSTWQL